ncbi:hypothetical protein DPEC_G00138940 [Dallia pectoralis]|uniref:Uncharacterized protein n=1 Tax=Dallia pectoralis TaxID=75939 RepID=A0ACC2GM26_DALPE|nr:hypothetical protein DPEC_G00138940 [Dallia pectoralis]
MFAVFGVCSIKTFHSPPHQAGFPEFSSFPFHPLPRPPPPHLNPPRPTSTHHFRPGTEAPPLADGLTSRSRSPLESLPGHWPILTAAGPRAEVMAWATSIRALASAVSTNHSGNAGKVEGIAKDDTESTEKRESGCCARACVFLTPSQLSRGVVQDKPVRVTEGCACGSGATVVTVFLNIAMPCDYKDKATASAGPPDVPVGGPWSGGANLCAACRIISLSGEGP